MLILRIGITPNGDVTATSAESTVLSKLWKRDVRDALYVRISGRTGRAPHERNPRTFNCVTILLYDLSIPKKFRGKPLEVKIHFEEGVETPYKVELALTDPESYKVKRPIDDLIKAVYRADELYADCGGPVSYKHPFSKIPQLREEIRKQFHTALVPLEEEVV